MKQHTILFTGHMIDAKNRDEPRFPGRKQTAAIRAIKKHLQQQKEIHLEPLVGIAGGAAGGDILFHEQCEKLAIPSEIYLALPAVEFKKTSVDFAGKEWETRFNRILKHHPVHICPRNSDDNRNIWKNANESMFHAARRNGLENMTLVALWDGKYSGEDGGTEHMVELARDAGAHTVIIDSKKF